MGRPDAQSKVDWPIKQRLADDRLPGQGPSHRFPRGWLPRALPAFGHLRPRSRKKQQPPIGPGVRRRTKNVQRLNQRTTLVLLLRNRPKHHPQAARYNLALRIATLLQEKRRPIPTPKIYRQTTQHNRTRWKMVLPRNHLRTRFQSIQTLQRIVGQIRAKYHAVHAIPRWRLWCRAP